MFLSPCTQMHSIGKKQKQSKIALVTQPACHHCWYWKKCIVWRENKSSLSFLRNCNIVMQQMRHADITHIFILKNFPPHQLAWGNLFSFLTRQYLALQNPLLLYSRVNSSKCNQGMEESNEIFRLSSLKYKINHSQRGSQGISGVHQHFKDRDQGWYTQII